MLKVYTCTQLLKPAANSTLLLLATRLRSETLPGDVGSQIKLVEVLAVKNDEGLKLGNPTIPGAFVTATVLSEGRHEKVRIFKFRRRKHSMKSAGHRQNYTELKIDEISA